MTKFYMLKYSFLAASALGILGISWRMLQKKKIGWVGKLWAVGIVAGALTLTDMYLIEPYWIEVKEVKIKDFDLSQVVGEYKIVQISDFHLTDGLGFRERQLIDKVNKLHPDFLFITGDFIDDLSQLGPARELISQLKAKEGIYGVPGNTDHIVIDSRSLRRELSPAGIDILINEGRHLRLPNGRILWIVGTDDPEYGYDDIMKALKNVPYGIPTIMMAHSPNIFDEAVREGINLLLAGDTHGGQVGILFLIRMSKYANQSPYMSGLFKRENTQMYVNRGIGTKTLPIRLFCRPEITVIKVVA